MAPILYDATRLAGTRKEMVAKIDFVLRTFGHIYSWWDFKSLSYTSKEPNTVSIFQSNSDIYTKPRAISDEEILMLKDIPLLFHSQKNQPLEFDERHVTFTFDFFAASFYFLSGWQEYVCDKKDQYDRFPYSRSIQSKLEIPTKPIVNYYFEMLCDAIEIVTGDRPKSSLWGNSSFGYHLSHDIDLCRTGWISEVKFALKRFNLASVARILVSKIMGKDPYSNVLEIAKKEKEKGISSTFFFLPETETYNGISQADYDIEDPQIQDYISGITEVGSQVMLHGSAGTSENGESLKRELKQLGRMVYGNRFHFLCWSQNHTPSILEDAGVKFDSTLGFAEHIGYRNGICHPFYLYNIESDRTTSILEYPLMVMDTTFYNRKYMSTDIASILPLVEGIMNESAKFNGMVSVLWHNNYFAEQKYQGWGDIYWSLIDLFKQNNGKSILFEDIYSNQNEP